MLTDKIVLKTTNPDELKTNRSFKIAIQLSRLSNLIRANQRQYLRIPNDKDPANMRDRFELILYHGAIVYEAIKTLLRYSKDLKNLPTWCQESETVKRLYKEWNNNKSFTNKYLKTVRNKLLFHYDIAAIERVVSEYRFDSEEIIFAEASSDSKIRLAFMLADQIILHYLMEQIDDNVDYDNRWGYFEERLLGISEDLSNVIEGCTIDLIKDYAYIQEHQ